MTSLRDIDDQIGVVHPTDPADLAAAAACVTRRISDEGERAEIMAMLGVF